MTGKTNNKSIFRYVTDVTNYINKNECDNYTPPFLSYIPSGVPEKNIDVDSILKGMHQHLSKCTGDKYRGEAVNLEKVKKVKECSKNFNILENGYMPFDKYK